LAEVKLRILQRHQPGILVVGVDEISSSDTSPRGWNGSQMLHSHYVLLIYVIGLCYYWPRMSMYGCGR